MMERYWYGLALIFSLSGLIYLDYQKKLAWFWDAKKTAQLLSISVGFFLVWDLVGIVLDVFRYNPRFVSGWYAFIPELPFEEFLFLGFISYLTLLLWRWRLCLPTS